MSAPLPRLAMLRFAVIFLIVAALLVLVLPLPVPRPVRLMVAAIDLIAASVVWLALRQRGRRN